MLFNSYEFIFLFLPVCLAGYFLCARYLSKDSAHAFLVLASLFFYAWWNPVYLILFLFSIGFNFFIGRLISREGRWRKKGVLVSGIVLNLALLVYFKYANFLIDNVNTLFGSGWNIGNIILPLAISFYTFQQIAYLVDAWRGKTSEYNFLHYCLFVCFFPQLIAGPIVHHGEILPQFMRGDNLSPKWASFAIGLSIFAIGLFKKTVLADSLSLYVGPVYDSGGLGSNVDFFRAWGSSLAYTFQLYFDFSGYSDMAIGLGLMFNINIPINFRSPYKATSILNFWQRWHITLTRFFNAYVYKPIVLLFPKLTFKAGLISSFLTMIATGIWHGAAWTFVVFGLMHGIAIVVNHLWRKTKIAMPPILGWLITFLFFSLTLVVFRAPTLEKSAQIAKAMFGMSGFEVPAGIVARTGMVGNWLSELGLVEAHGGGSFLVTNYIWILVSAAICLGLPNVAQIFHRDNPALKDRDPAFTNVSQPGPFRWCYSNYWAIAVSAAGVAAVLTLQQVSEFLYFQF